MAPFPSSFEQALIRYRADVFTDADVTRCIGLSARSIRELIKVRAVRTRSEDRGAGRVRSFDATTFKRLAVLAAINGAGFSLRVAGQLAYLLPSDHHLFQILDPINVLFDTTASVDDGSDLPPRRKTPPFDWFDADKPAVADPKTDWLLEFYEGRFVAQVAQEGRFKLIYGDLRKAGTEFVSWWPFQAELDEWTDTGVSPKWEGKRAWADRINHRFLNYRHEPHDGDNDPLAQLAHAVAQRPVFTTTINLSLAIRLGLRRYLELEPSLPKGAGS